MRTYLSAAIFAASLAWPVATLAEDGLITQSSANSAEDTTNKLEAAIEGAGFKVFARLDHAAAAAEAGLEMPYSTVVVFGNPKLGTPAFLQTPALAIDLPLKALVWEDAEGNVFVSYNSSTYMFETIYERHGQPYPPEMIDRLGGAMAKMVGASTGG